MRKKSIKILILITALFTLLYTSSVYGVSRIYYTITVEDTPNGKIEALDRIIALENLNINVTPNNGYILDSLTIKNTSILTPTIEKTNYFEKISVSKDEWIAFTLSEDYDSDNGLPGIDIELNEDNLDVRLFIDVQGDRKIYTNNASPISFTGAENSTVFIYLWSSTGGSIDLYDKSENNYPILAKGVYRRFQRVNYTNYSWIENLDYRASLEIGKTLFEIPYTKVNDNLYRVKNVEGDLAVSGTFVKESITPSIELNEYYEYTGNEIRPNIVVKDAENNIIPSDKYVVSYENNIEIGTGTLTITNIDGEYPRFNKSVNFNIKTPGSIEQRINETNYGKAIIANDVLNTIIDLTEEEKSSRASGKKIYSFIEVKELEETEDLKNIVKDKIRDNTKELIYLDVSLFKQVEGQEKEKITTVGKKIKVAIDLPKGIKSTDSIYIIREHAGNVEVIDAKVEGDKLVFETDKFSTYVIGYTDVNNPGTGDPIFLFVGGLILSMICLAVVIKFYRK